MQMKNVNLLQSPEVATIASVVQQPATAAPPLPPRSTLAGRPLPGTPPPPPQQHHHHHDASSSCCQQDPDQPNNCSVYTSVPKGVPPPYRQPPFPTQGQYVTVGSRLNNEPPPTPPQVTTVPGSLQPDPSPTYVTHSSKFPVKREPRHAAQDGSGPSRIPHLADVVRQQRPRSANSSSNNSVAPEPRPQPRAQQAWVEGRRTTTLPDALPRVHDRSSSSSSSWQHRAPAADDDGEPLLIRARSGPLYPLGIENLAATEHAESPYGCARPSSDGGGSAARGNDQANLYRAQFVTTNDATTTESSLLSVVGKATSRLPGGGRSVAPQDCGRTNDDENPYARTVVQMNESSSSSCALLTPPQQFHNETSEVDAVAAASSHIGSVESAYGRTTGPSVDPKQRRYYLLKDMVSGQTDDADCATSGAICEQVAEAEAETAADRKEEETYGRTKRGAIYGLMRQQQTAVAPRGVRKIAQRFLLLQQQQQHSTENFNATEAGGNLKVSEDVRPSSGGGELKVSGSRLASSSRTGSPSHYDDLVNGGGRSRVPSTEMLTVDVECKQQEQQQMSGKTSGGRRQSAEWRKSMERELDQVGDCSKKQSYGDGSRTTDRLSLHESTFSDSFSVTPPLPPLSPSSQSRSPSRNTHKSSKLSLGSGGHLHKSSGMTPDILETTRRGSSYPSRDNAKSSSKKGGGGSSKSKLGVSGSAQDLRSWNNRKYSSPLQCRIPLTQSASRSPKISLGGGGTSVESRDGEVTSTTTGLDMDSLLDEGDLSTDDLSSQMEGGGTDMVGIRRQLESLETMYSEVMKMLGVKVSGQRSLHDLRPARRKVYGSLTSLTGIKSGSTRGERTGQHTGDRKRTTRESKGVGRRFQRLESHVVTLARSVAHLSSEMRTQHIMFQQLESLRLEVAQLHEHQQQQQQQQHRGGGRPGRGAGGTGGGWDNFRSCIPSLTNPGRVKKLTKFFGDEPPLLRLFLKNLGYEKYASQFEAEKIGIIELPYLTEERLQKIGIPMGPRMRILQEAQMSFRQEHFNIYIV